MQSKVAGLVGTTVVCIFGFVLCALFLMYAASPWIDHNQIPFFGSRLRDTAIFFILGASGISVTVGLARGRRWAWWSAFMVVVLVLSMAVFFSSQSSVPEMITLDQKAGSACSCHSACWFPE
jgi:hypothetical protein